MSLLTRAWVSYGRLRRRFHKPSASAWEQERRAWIADNAPGRSFVDVGGLFHYEGDIAFAAEAAGAREVTLLDAGEPGLTRFEGKRRERGSEVRFVQGDVEDPETIRAVGRHDIVWCTGVIYHSPNPVRQLMLLREITGELLYLGSHTLPEMPGVKNVCVYYPYLDDEQREAHAAAHRGGEVLWGLRQPFEDKPMWGHGNFWWGISLSALRSMLATARFEVIEERRTRESPFFTELVAKPIERDPILPPVSYFRECSELRERTGERMPFDDYYERRRRD